jgi:membrane protein YdbS with pleckstrin-like domain
VKIIFTLIMSRKKKTQSVELPQKKQQKSTKSIGLFQIFALIVLIAVFLMPILSLVTNRATPQPQSITIPQSTLSGNEIQVPATQVQSQDQTKIQQNTTQP